MPAVLSLRAAIIADSDRLLEWRNDHDTCSASLSGGPIEWSGHVRWLFSVLADTCRELLIAELDGEPVGTVRIDREGHEAELSWTVAPAFRRRGIGTAMVRLALPLGVTVARIKQDNVASQKIAARAGFALLEDGELQLWRRSDLDVGQAVSSPTLRAIS